jgi:hypothetical protein
MPEDRQPNRPIDAYKAMIDQLATETSRSVHGGLWFRSQTSRDYRSLRTGSQESGLPPIESVTCLRSAPLPVAGFFEAALNCRLPWAEVGAKLARIAS